MQYRLIKLTAMAVVALFASQPASALSADWYKTNSSLSTGHWVKIKVSQSGIQQITHDQLRQWGFDDPSKVTVHGFGGVVGHNEKILQSIPDDMGQQPVVRTSDRILFYGESNVRPNYRYLRDNTARIAPSVDHNNAADAGYYFVTDAIGVDVTPSEITYSPTASVVDSHMSLLYFENNVDNPFNMGQNYFGKQITPSEPQTITFDLPGRAYSTSSSCNIIMHPVVVGGESVSHPISMTYTSSATGTSTEIISLPQLADYQYFTSNIITGSGTNYFTTWVDAGIEKIDVTFSVESSAYAALDYIGIAYPRTNNLGTSSSMIISSADMAYGTTEVISDATSDFKVWNISYPYDVRPYQTVYSTSDRTMRFSVERQYKVTSTDDVSFRAIVFDPARQHNPVEYAGEVANQNIHGNAVPDMIILTSKVCAAQAERLAELHRNVLNQEVLVLNQEEIFNEFSSGTPSTWGIRRMVKTFYDRGLNSDGTSSKLRYFMLFGGSSFDNQGLTTEAVAHKANGALLLNYSSPSHSTQSFKTDAYSSDQYFVLLGDDVTALNLESRHMSIAVGRIPALDEAKATTAVDKIEDYLTNPPAVDFVHRVISIGDAGGALNDNNSHMANAEKCANTMLNNMPGITVVKGYNSIYPWKITDAFYLRSAIEQALKMGTNFLTYSGHGKPDSFSGNLIWSVNHVLNTEYSFYPLAMLATCDSYLFDRSEQSIAEEMIFQPKGGMIGVIGACRTVYQNRNQYLNEDIATAYASADESTSIGDIFRIGRNNLFKRFPNTTPIHVNTLCYNLGGDPGLPVYVASRRMNISKINGSDYNGTDTYSIIPLNSNTIEGYIAKEAGSTEVDETFNGTVILSLYEAPITRTTFNGRVAYETATDITMDEDVMLETTAKVVNGRYSVTFTPPVPSRMGDSNRLTLYAYNEDNTKRVQAYAVNTLVDGSLTDESQISDTDAPVITELYIDTPSFKSGDSVEGVFTIYAVIDADESGIRKSMGTIGGSTRFTIDGSRIIPVVGTSMTGDPEGRTHVQCQVTDVTDGRHTLDFSISDNLGNSASRQIEFVVINKPSTATLAVAERPARTEANLSLTHTFGETPSGRLVIEDSNGITVFSKENCTFPFTWDLMSPTLDSTEENPQSELVADGIYRAYAILKSGLQYATTPKAEIVVIQKR